MQISVPGPLKEVLSEFSVEFGKTLHRIKYILVFPPERSFGKLSCKAEGYGQVC